MPTVLLPSSAAAFAPRSSPSVALDQKVPPWLAATLRRVNRVKRPLKSVTQHIRCLKETLASPKAIWNLCSMMFTEAPDAELRKDDDPLIEGLFNYQMIHIEAYVVCVDMVARNEVAFKLTPETIENLVDYHKEIYSVDAAASTWEWSEKQSQLMELQETFVQAANEFRANAGALEGLEEDGTGELLCELSEEAKQAILNLFVPMLPPPPPSIVEMMHPIIVPPSSTGSEAWLYAPIPLFRPMSSWGIISCGPAGTEDFDRNRWASLELSEAQLPSLTQSCCQSSAPDITAR